MCVALRHFQLVIINYSSRGEGTRGGLSTSDEGSKECGGGVEVIPPCTPPLARPVSPGHCAEAENSGGRGIRGGTGPPLPPGLPWKACLLVPFITKARLTQHCSHHSLLVF